ncbi:MAG: glycosyltransferase [Phycisphaerae bacterium]|nr:glycosyltransferase [Phycisphaerae bacterium]
MITDRNIVCIASNWFAHPTSKQHVMRLLSRDNHVLWINYHASRRPKMNATDSRAAFSRLLQISGGVQHVAPRLDVLSPLLIPYPESRLARSFNAWRLGCRIRAALRKLPARPTQLWLFAPDVPEIIPRIPNECTVYYCVDEFAAFVGFNADLITSLERRTVASSDLVIATSQPLLERMRAMHDNAHFVPHGVDLEHFAVTATLQQDDIPADVADLPNPVLGYFGIIADYVNLGVIARAARERPAWSFVLIGEKRCPTTCCDNLPNVHLLGPRPYETLPAYCRKFDVGLIPFRMNRLVHAVNPIKLREYLAAGLPVVSSPMPEVRRCGAGVHVAENDDGFVDACERALEASHNESPATRREIVACESWQVRVATLAELVANATRRGGAAANGPPAGNRRSRPGTHAAACPARTV